MSSLSLCCARSVSLVALIAAAPAQGPTMLRDLNTTPVEVPESAPSQGLAFGGWTYFSADRRDTGRELFRTGVAAGTTELFADLVPGPGDSWPHALTVFQGQLWFAAGQNLWTTDGTTAGTVLVKSFADGPRELTVSGASLFFAAGETWSNGELWKTDGTTAGTVQVADIHAGPFSSGPTGLTWLGGDVYFGATDGINGRELWRSDGSTAGTVMVRNIAPGSAPSSPQVFAVLGSRLYFFAQDTIANVELWRTDGTVGGTQVVREIGPGAAGSVGVTSQLVVAGGELFFVADDAVHGRELWASDGTSAGTRMVRDVWQGSSSGALGTLSVAGTTVFFQGSDGATGTELWRSDGTMAGTRLVADLNPGSAAGLPTGFGRNLPYALGNALFVSATDGQTGIEPWITDGATMTRLADVSAAGSSFPQPLALDPTAQRLFFSADNGVLGTELYATDGTPTGTELWDDIYQLGPETLGSAPRELVDAFGRVFFKATDGSSVSGPQGQAVGPTPWVSDGTAPGTTQVTSLWTTATSTAVTLEGDWLFRAYTAISGHGPWRTDGTAAGTALIPSLNPLVSPAMPREFTVLGSSAMFVATDQTTGASLLWYTNGSVSEPLTSAGPSQPWLPWNLVELDGRLLFLDQNFGGTILWRSDGTRAGTQQVAAIDAQSMVAAERWAYVAVGFPAELWRTNGYPAGMQPLRRFATAPSELTAVRGSLFFTAWEIFIGEELWFSNGTAAGTRLVADLVPGSGSSQPHSLAAFRDGVLFSAQTAANGRELWFSDGTAQGTVLVADLVPGPGSASPAEIVAVGSRRAVFSADDGVAGRELWITDGSSAGTSLLGDLNANGDSDPLDMTLSGGRIVFTADDGVHGREPWVFDPGATAQRVGLGCAIPGGIRPLLESADPVLGAPIKVTARILAPGSFNALLLGAPRTGLRWSGECFLFLQPATIAVLSSSVTGASWQVTVPLPAVPALTGARTGLQLISLLTSGQIEFTNAVVWTLGM